MANPSKKQRLSVYLEPEVMKALAAHAARRDQSRSLVAEAAIASFLSPDAAERQEAATTKRLDQLDRRMTRMERDMGISVEMLAVFAARTGPGRRPGAGRRALRRLRCCARPSTRQGAEAASGDFRRHRARARRAISTDFGNSSIRRFRRTPVFVRHSTTSKTTCCRGPISGSFNHPRSRGGLTRSRIERGQRGRFFREI